MYLLDLHCVLRRLATSSCSRHVDESATGLSLSPHREHGTGCRQSGSCCGRPLLFVVNWKHFCPNLPTDIGKIDDCFVMRLRSSVGGAIQMTLLQLQLYIETIMRIYYLIGLHRLIIALVDNRAIGHLQFSVICSFFYHNLAHLSITSEECENYWLHLHWNWHISSRLSTGRATYLSANWFS